MGGSLKGFNDVRWKEKGFSERKGKKWKNFTTYFPKNYFFLPQMLCSFVQRVFLGNRKYHLFQYVNHFRTGAYASGMAFAFCIEKPTFHPLTIKNIKSPSYFMFLKEFFFAYLLLLECLYG